MVGEFDVDFSHGLLSCYYIVRRRPRQLQRHSPYHKTVPLHTGTISLANARGALGRIIKAAMLPSVVDNFAGRGA